MEAAISARADFDLEAYFRANSPFAGALDAINFQQEAYVVVLA